MILTQLKRPTYYFPLALLALMGVFPLWIKDPFYLHIFIMVLFAAALSSAWNLIGGYGGQLSLGHTAFFGVGAYCSSILFLNFSLSPWVGMLLGGLLASGLSIIVGYPCFRLKGAFFALATLAIAEVLRILSINFDDLTKGSMGIRIPFRPSIVNFIFYDKISYAYIALCLLFLMLAISLAIGRSKMGYYLVALKEDEDASKVIGINTIKIKLLAIILSAFFTAICGTFYAQYILFIEPDAAFSSELSVHMALVAIIGGVGTAAGPLFGSLLMTPLGEFLRSALGGEYRGLHLIIYGIILILVVMLIPKGIHDWVKIGFERFIQKFLPGKRETEERDILSNYPLWKEEGNLQSESRRQTRIFWEAREVSKFFGGLAALSNVNLKVYEGEILGLIGPNGAGKTTFFNVISGLLKPDKGTIIFQGKEITELKPHSICLEGIGRTFQIVKPFPNISALGNVMTACFCREKNSGKAKSKSLEIINFVGLWNKRNFPAGSLTIAEKKFLELAKALATCPKLILLDEVMAGLNPTEVSEALQLIKKINQQGISLIIIEHVMSIIMTLCERIMVLNHGEKIAEGSPEEIAHNSAVIEAYLGQDYINA
jgi:branched-chain amino acid transport system permease protein